MIQVYGNIRQQKNNYDSWLGKTDSTKFIDQGDYATK